MEKKQVSETKAIRAVERAFENAERVVAQAHGRAWKKAQAIIAELPAEAAARTRQWAEARYGAPPAPAVVTPIDATVAA